VKQKTNELEGARDSAYLRQVIFTDAPFLEKISYWPLTPKAQKFRGSHDPGHTIFRKNVLGVMSGLSLETCTPNLKSVALAILELLAFDVQKN